MVASLEWSEACGSGGGGKGGDWAETPGKGGIMRSAGMEKYAEMMRGNAENAEIMRILCVISKAPPGTLKTSADQEPRAISRWGASTSGGYVVSNTMTIRIIAQSMVAFVQLFRLFLAP